MGLRGGSGSSVGSGVPGPIENGKKCLMPGQITAHVPVYSTY